MTEIEIGVIINPQYPGVYAITDKPTKLKFKNGQEAIGFFQPTIESEELKKDNKYSFVEYRNAQKYRDTNSAEYITIVEGDLLESVEYPASPSALL